MFFTPEGMFLDIGAVQDISREYQEIKTLFVVLKREKKQALNKRSYNGKPIFPIELKKMLSTPDSVLCVRLMGENWVTIVWTFT